MEKEPVQKFDLQAAFKALDEIETPKAEKGIKANRVDLKERFSSKDGMSSLVEDYYSLNDPEALEEAQEDREEEVAKAKLAKIEKIVDLDAESPEDLQPSYVGRVIIQCPQCMTLFYKKPEDIEKSEENPDVVNINEVCQHCGNASGYTVVGKVAEVEPSEEANFETEPEESELNQDFGEPTEEVSPEGTGGGFEDELNIEATDSEGSDEFDLDLDIDEVELDKEEKKEESVETPTATVLTEDLDDGSSDGAIVEPEVAVTVEEVKEIAQEVGEQVVEQEAETTEEVQAIVDEVVAQEVSPVETEEETEVEAEEVVEEGIKQPLTEGTTVQEINDKLSAHNEYIAYLQQSIEKEAEELKKAKNEEIKKAIQGRIDNLKNELEAALPDAVKDEVKSDDLPTPEEAEQEVKIENNEETEEVKESLNEAEASSSDIANILTSVADNWDNLGESLHEDGIDAGEFKKLVNSQVWKKFDESIEDVKAALPEITDELRHAGEEAAIEAGEETDEEAEVEEGYKGTPEERTTHLEYTDDDPIDGKAVLPDNIEKQLTEDAEEAEEVNEMPWWISFDEPKQENEYAQDVEEAIGHAINHLNGAKDEGLLSGVAGLANGLGQGIKDIPVVGQLLASDDAEKKDVQEDIIYTKTDSAGRIDNRTQTQSAETETPSIVKPASDVIDADIEEGIADGLIPNMDFGGVNINVDASGQNNAAGFGGSNPKVESCENCEGEECKDCKDIKECGEKPLQEEEKVFIKGRYWTAQELKDRLLGKTHAEPTQEGIIDHIPGLNKLGIGNILGEDFNEASFDEHVNKYLTEVYSNVKDYKTTSCSIKEDKLIIEGTINFNSGKSKNTVFEFVNATDNNGHVVLEGYNKDLAEGKAFTVEGVREADTVFLTEGLSYDYTVNNNSVKGSTK